MRNTSVILVLPVAYQAHMATVVKTYFKKAFPVLAEGRREALTSETLCIFCRDCVSTRNGKFYRHEMVKGPWYFLVVTDTGTVETSLQRKLRHVKDINAVLDLGLWNHVRVIQNDRFVEEVLDFLNIDKSKLTL